MRVFPSRLRVIGGLALAGLPVLAVGQPIGSEFQVNAYTTNTQRPRDRVIAADAHGNFVVVWFGEGKSERSGIFGRRFDSAGEPLGAEFRVNSERAGIQWYPGVASDANGNFVVVWEDAKRDDIFGRRFDAAGDPVGAEFRVNSYTTGYQRTAAVASDASGNFVVVWGSFPGVGSGEAIFGQRYDASGHRRGSEFRVNSDDRSSNPAVASDAAGNFVVVWQNLYGNYNRLGIFGQRFDSAGVPRGGRFRVNTYTPDAQVQPAVASDASGNFVVTWDSHYQDGSEWGVFGQRFDDQGVPQGGEFRVNSFTTRNQLFSDVALDTAGNFVVSWTSYGQDGSGQGVFGQRYDSAGVPQGLEFQINSYTTAFQMEPSVVSTGASAFVVIWESNGQDGDDAGVFGKRFDFSGKR